MYDIESLFETIDFELEQCKERILKKVDEYELNYDVCVGLKDNAPTSIKIAMANFKNAVRGELLSEIDCYLSDLNTKIVEDLENHWTNH